MIKNIVFDFGDVFINLDKEASFRRLKELGVKEFMMNYWNQVNNMKWG